MSTEQSVMQVVPLEVVSSKKGTNPKSGKPVKLIIVPCKFLPGANEQPVCQGLLVQWVALLPQQWMPSAHSVEHPMWILQPVTGRILEI